MCRCRTRYVSDTETRLIQEMSVFHSYNIFFFLLNSFTHLKYQSCSIKIKYLKMRIFLCICKYCSFVILNYLFVVFSALDFLRANLHRKVANLKRRRGKGAHLYSNFKFQTSVMNVNDRTCDVF